MSPRPELSASIQVGSTRGPCGVSGRAPIPAKPACFQRRESDKNMSSIKIVCATKLSRCGVVVCAIATILFVSMPFWTESDVQRTLTEFFYFLALAQIWNLLAGYGGLYSFGQQVYIGFGSYALVMDRSSSASILLSRWPCLACWLGSWRSRSIRFFRACRAPILPLEPG